MRKLAFTCMLALGMSATAFANTIETKEQPTLATSETTPKVEVKQVEKTAKPQVDEGCLIFHFSCGGSEEICHFGLVDFMTLLFVLEGYDEYTCGG